MQHHIVYIPGLADKLNRRFGQATALALWRLNGMHAHYFVVGWADKQESFEQKLARLLKRIDHLTARGHRVSLVSVSAGASLAMIALYERPQAINAVINIVGKLHNPQTIADAVYATNPAFRASLERFGTINRKFTAAERARVLTVLSKKDSLVPAGDALLEGSKIEQLPTQGHLLTIFAALTIFRRRLISFLQRTKI
jgi:dienelactone hydrolase